MESLRKTLIYFKKWDSYWRLTDPNETLAVDSGKCGRYPLDFKPRIKEGHYPFFDNNGVPMWPRSDGKSYLYHYTTMCSYALGQSDFYYLTGEELYLNNLTAVADYIIKSGVKEGEDVLLREMDNDNKHTGNISAMSQGEAISVLCRVSEITGKELYMQYALQMLGPFKKGIEERGVVGIISKIDCKWYEEYVTTPLEHVLNGMIYSLWGLRDLYNLTGKDEPGKLFNDGIEYVSKALPLFDTGYWSYYWVPENSKPYVASMMYHNLHICQLDALHNQTGLKIFKEYADKFKAYTASPFSRVRAVKDIVFAKFLNL